VKKFLYSEDTDLAEWAEDKAKFAFGKMNVKNMSMRLTK
jgi:hypothetical protein